MDPSGTLSKAPGPYHRSLASRPSDAIHRIRASRQQIFDACVIVAVAVGALN